MANPIEVGSTLAGYTIEAQIGRGGMGVVYRAKQESLGRQVAVKVIAPEFARDDSFRERFKRESRLAAAIEHPNAIPIYETGEEGEILYLAMRYVEGTDMRSLIADEGPLEPMRAAEIVDQIAGALDEAHALGLVHRDVKPGNILISHSRGRERAFLTDFGLTKDIRGTSALTATGQWVGTVDYACPEQIEGKRVDARADVYALGCVLFEGLTGRVPFPKESEMAKLFAHANEIPPRLSSIVPNVPEALDDVLARSLAKTPHERFPSAGDLGRAALAASVGASVEQPERTVAAGAAAPISQPAVPAPAPPKAPAPRPSQGTIAADPTRQAATPAPEVPATSPADPRAQAETLRLGEPGSPKPPPRDRNRRTFLAGAAALLLALVTAGFLLLRGDGGGTGDGTEPGSVKAGDTAGGEIEFESMSTPAFTLEVPEGWVPNGVEEPLDGDPNVLRSTFDNPEKTMRLSVVRAVNGTLPPAEQAELVAATADIKMLSLEPDVTIKGRDSARVAVVKDDREFGPGTLDVIHFLLDPEAGEFRIHSIGDKGADDRDLLQEIGERATATIESL